MITGRIRVAVAYASPERQAIRELILPQGSTVGDALRVSGLAQLAPDESVRLAIYGKRVGADARLRDGDRVEILRPLLADPKELRRTRAARKRPAR